MSTAKDITDQRFNRLVAIQSTTERQGKKVMWLCQCDCGNKTKAPTSALINGHTGSCGCYARDQAKYRNRLPKGEASFNSVYHHYQWTAKKKGLVFKLSKDQFRHLATQDCFYCGDSPAYHYDKPNRNGKFKRNGIDRMDNEKGYTIDNTVPCCFECNKMKNSTDIGKFLTHVNRIAERHSLIETEGTPGYGVSDSLTPASVPSYII